MADFDETRLREKLRALEALHAKPGSEGERAAAENARERILGRLRELAAVDPPVEFRFSMPDMWSRRVFIALLRRYGITPYRYRGQRYTTVNAEVSKRFVDETLWPEYLALSESLRAYLDEVTDRVVADVIHADVSEAEVMDEPKQLGLDVSPEAPAPAPAATVANHAATAATPSTVEPDSEDARRRRRNERKRKKKRQRR